MPAVLNRKLPFALVYDPEAEHGYEQIQDGVLKRFRPDGIELGGAVAAAPSPSPAAPPPAASATEGHPLPAGDPWKAWKVPHLRHEYRRATGGKDAPMEWSRKTLIEELEKIYEAAG